MRTLPKFSAALGLSAPLLSLVVAQTVDAGTYLKIDSIDGESMDSGHVDWINLDSFSWGIVCDPNSPTGGAPEVKDLVITKYIDKASPKLMLACGTGATGGSIPAVTVELTDPARNNGLTYYKVTFENCHVTSYISGPAAGEPQQPTESVSFNFTKITYIYHAADGSDPVTVVRDFNPAPPQ